MLACELYNKHKTHPGKLLVENDDKLFPDLKGKILGIILKIKRLYCIT